MDIAEKKGDRDGFRKALNFSVIWDIITKEGALHSVVASAWLFNFKGNHMKELLFARFSAVLLAAVFFFVPGVSSAQQETVIPGSSPKHYKIQKLTSLDKDYRQRARSLGSSSAKAKEWGCFDVSFLTLPPVIGEISITYTVMFQTDKPLVPGDKTMTLFKTTVDYVDVVSIKSKEHLAGVCLLPGALQRHGKPIGFAVQIFFDGQEVASDSVEVGILAGRKSWWTDSKIIDSPNVATREGCLVDRMKSPFQLNDLDSYEVSR